MTGSNAGRSDVRHADQGLQAPDPRRWRALALLGTAFFMVILDGTIVITALPVIGHELGLATGGLQWVISAYLICFGGFLLLGGRSADLLGRRRVFTAGVGLFIASSLACGLAPGAGVLIAARVVQGVSAAIMAPSALSLLMTVFPEGPERNKALGIWGGIGGVGATAGLLIGGPITDALGWEWIFLINVPIGVGLLALTPRLLPESVDPDCVRCFDVAGAVTVTSGVLALVLAIAEAPDAGWGSLQTIGLLAGSAALLVAFVWIEARSTGPLVPLRIFRSRSLIGGNLVLLTAGMCVDGMLVIATLYAQNVLGYSTIQFGLMTAVMTVMSVVGAYTAQNLVGKVGPLPVALAGMSLIAAACVLFTQVSVNGSYIDDLFVGFLLFGPGLGAAFVASQIASLTGVAERESGLAAGLVDSAFHVGSALGIAIVTTVAVAQTEDALEDGGAELGAITEGFQSAFAAAVGFAIVGALMALLFLRRGSTAEVERAPTIAAGRESLKSKATPDGGVDPGGLR
jgi:EmrB/QacA subfamily drug resistance transporter